MKSNVFRVRTTRITPNDLNEMSARALSKVLRLGTSVVGLAQKRCMRWKSAKDCTIVADHVLQMYAGKTSTAGKRQSLGKLPILGFYSHPRVNLQRYDERCDAMVMPIFFAHWE